MNIKRIQLLSTLLKVDLRQDIDFAFRISTNLNKFKTKRRFMFVTLLRDLGLHGRGFLVDADLHSKK